MYLQELQNRQGRQHRRTTTSVTPLGGCASGRTQQPPGRVPPWARAESRTRQRACPFGVETWARTAQWGQGWATGAPLVSHAAPGGTQGPAGSWVGANSQRQAPPRAPPTPSSREQSPAQLPGEELELLSSPLSARPAQEDRSSRERATVSYHKGARSDKLRNGLPTGEREEQQEREGTLVAS